MNEFKIKRKREIVGPQVLYAIKCFITIFAVLFVICMSTGAELFTFKHLLIYSIYSIPLCILYAYIVEKLGSGLGGILSDWTTRKFSRREQLSADLAKARSSRSGARFEEALSIINGVLDKDPEFPDALFLKAQILWDGFENSRESKDCLRRLMQTVPHEEPLHRWASSFFDEIIRTEKKRYATGLPNAG